MLRLVFCCIGGIPSSSRGSRGPLESLQVEFLTRRDVQDCDPQAIVCIFPHVPRNETDSPLLFIGPLLLQLAVGRACRTLPPGFRENRNTAHPREPWTTRQGEEILNDTPSCLQALKVSFLAVRLLLFVSRWINGSSP